MADNKHILSVPPAYRADAKKPGSVETRSISRSGWDLKQIYDIATGMPTAAAHGVATPTAEQLVNRMLVEGRSDAGVNQYDYNNKADVALHDKLLAAGVAPLAATFAAAMQTNMRKAARKGISLDEAYNGTGRSAVTGKTGKDYAARMAASTHAVTDPKNAQLLDYVQRAMTGALTPQEHLQHSLPAAELDRRLSGDLSGSPYASLAWNYDYKDPQQKAVMATLSSLSQLPKRAALMPDSTVTQAALNTTRRVADMPPREHPDNMTATEKTVADLLSELPVFKTMMDNLAISRQGAKP